MAELKAYNRKRDPRKTPEPFGGAKRSGAKSKPIFVIQRHDARRLHYDFRLERNGALAFAAREAAEVLTFRGPYRDESR